MMNDFKFVYGPVPSRRLGKSLGISPIPKKTCNYSCTYCQLGRTNNLTNIRKMYFRIDELMDEFDKTMLNQSDFDVVTIVGEGEPTLYLGLGELISEIKKRTEKPVAVITNGSLIGNLDVQMELSKADIVLPSMDAYNDVSFKRINRPHGKIHYNAVYQGLKDFSQKYTGQLWIEIMLVKDVNDNDFAFHQYTELLKGIRYDRLYINTPIRPPAEDDVKAITHEMMEQAVNVLGGISIDLLHSKGFYSEIPDDYEAIISIIKRHPMNQFEIESFLSARGCNNIDIVLYKLRQSKDINIIDYKGYETYRLS